MQKEKGSAATSATLRRVVRIGGSDELELPLAVRATTAVRGEVGLDPASQGADQIADHDLPRRRDASTNFFHTAFLPKTHLLNRR